MEGMDGLLEVSPPSKPVGKECQPKPVDELPDSFLEKAAAR